MADAFKFKDRFANMRTITGIRSRSGAHLSSYDFIFEKADDLTALLSMSSEEEIDFGDEKMPYSQFKQRYFDNARRIYTSSERELLDMLESPVF